MMPTYPIKAQWAGKCATCGKPTPKDSTIQYDRENKTGYHDNGQCAPGATTDDDPQPDSAIELAERLGFK